MGQWAGGNMGLYYLCCMGVGPYSGVHTLEFISQKFLNPNIFKIDQVPSTHCQTN